MPRKRTAILLYHGVRECEADAIRDRLYSLPRGAVAAQVSWLRQSGYQAVPLGRLLSFEEGWEGRFGLTIDDGLASAYTELFPLIAAAGFSALFFAIAGTVGRRGWLSWEQLAEMARAGMEIGSHTVTHANLGEAPPRRVREELLESKKILEQGAGVRVRYLSLPGGYRSPSLREAAIDAGFEAVCGSLYGYTRPETDRCAIPRFCLKGGDGVAAVRGIMRGGWRIIPRSIAERGKDAARRALGGRAYAALRRRIMPRGVHHTLPHFPSGGED